MEKSLSEKLHQMEKYLGYALKVHLTMSRYPLPKCLLKAYQKYKDKEFVIYYNGWDNCFTWHAWSKNKKGEDDEKFGYLGHRDGNCPMTDDHRRELIEIYEDKVRIKLMEEAMGEIYKQKQGFDWLFMPYKSNTKQSNLTP